jgi:hypothetical protein
VYSTLAEVRDREENCKKAIVAFQEALRVHTLERLPMQYAMTQNNLGSVYGTLAEVRDREENCKKAIVAFQEALRVYTLERFPDLHERTKKNLTRALLICKGRESR